MKRSRKVKRLFRALWPWLATASGALAGLFLAPAAPPADWWPTAEWAQHALTGVGVGIGVLLVGAVLGVVTGSISVPGLNLNNEPENVEDLREIKSQLADVVDTQRELTKTSTEALTLAREATRALLERG